MKLCYKLYVASWKPAGEKKNALQSVTLIMRM